MLFNLFSAVHETVMVNKSEADLYLRWADVHLSKTGRVHTH